MYKLRAIDVSASQIAKRTIDQPVRLNPRLTFFFRKSCFKKQHRNSAGVALQGSVAHLRHFLTPCLLVERIHTNSFVFADQYSTEVELLFVELTAYPLM